MLTERISTKLTANDSTAKEDLGRFYQTVDSTYGTRLFKYVLNGGVVGVAGGACCQKMAATVAVGYTVQVPTDTSDENLAGIWMAAVTADYYGWIQILGYHTAVCVSTAVAAIAAYDSLKVTSAQGQYMITSQVIGTAPTFVKYVRGLEAYTTVSTTGTIKGYVCVGIW